MKSRADHKISSFLWRESEDRVEDEPGQPKREKEEGREGKGLRIKILCQREITLDRNLVKGKKERKKYTNKGVKSPKQSGKKSTYVTLKAKKKRRDIRQESCLSRGCGGPPSRV